MTRSSEVTRRIGGGCATVLLVLLGFLVALAIAEGLARLLGAPYQVASRWIGSLYVEDEAHRCDRILGWRGVPGFSAPISIDGKWHQVTLNSRGMHDVEHSVRKPDGVYRIMLLGDSFIEAAQVEEDQTSRHVLEELLNAHVLPNNTRIEVIAAGVGAWGPGQELLYFRSEGRLFSPDLLVVLWVPVNDLQDNLPDYRLTHDGFNCYAPYLAICGEVFDPEPWYSAPGVPPTWKDCSEGKRVLTMALNRLYFSSRLYQWIEPLLMHRDTRIRLSHPFSPWSEHSDSDPVLAYAYELNAGIYTQLRDEAREIGAKTALVIVPYKQVVRASLDPTFRDDVQKQLPQLKNADLEKPNRVFGEMMQARGVPVLDLQPHIVTYAKNGGRPLYWEIDSHWNVDGNRFVATVIADWLVDQKLVPQSN